MHRKFKEKQNQVILSLFMKITVISARLQCSFKTLCHCCLIFQCLKSGIIMPHNDPSKLKDKDLCITFELSSRIL